MVTYEVTSNGVSPNCYQVTAISPEFQGEVVGDFSSLEAAEAFADSMRKIDAAPVHSDRNQPPLSVGIGLPTPRNRYRHTKGRRADFQR
jgi:hypothetical protein